MGSGLGRGAPCAVVGIDCLGRSRAGTTLRCSIFSFRLRMPSLSSLCCGAVGYRISCNSVGDISVVHEFYFVCWVEDVAIYIRLSVA